jgi:hypothetical protein
MDKKTIWITWERHRRTREIAQRMEIPLFELLSNRNRLIRYLSLSVRTTIILVKEKPNFLIIQCPSIILFFIVVLFKKFFRYRLVCDAHNAAVYPEKKYEFLKPLYAKILSPL